jgi:hypothetical protein
MQRQHLLAVRLAPARDTGEAGWRHLPEERHGGGRPCLAADGSELHLYLTEIYPTVDFAHPADLAAELVGVAGPFVAQPTRQPVVIGCAQRHRPHPQPPGRSAGPRLGRRARPVGRAEA